MPSIRDPMNSKITRNDSEFVTPTRLQKGRWKLRPLFPSPMPYTICPKPYPPIQCSVAHLLTPRAVRQQPPGGRHPLPHGLRVVQTHQTSARLAEPYSTFARMHHRLLGESHRKFCHFVRERSANDVSLTPVEGGNLLPISRACVVANSYESLLLRQVLLLFTHAHRG